MQHRGAALKKGQFWKDVKVSRRVKKGPLTIENDGETERRTQQEKGTPASTSSSRGRVQYLSQKKQHEEI